MEKNLFCPVCGRKEFVKINARQGGAELLRCEHCGEIVREDWPEYGKGIKK